MLKKLIATVATVACCWSPAQAQSVADVRELVDLIKGTGTEVVHDTCDNPDMYGFYVFDKEKGLDGIVLCSNKIDMEDSTAVWDTLAHESVHVMQACNKGENIVKLEKHPTILRELQSSAPHLYGALQGYTGRHKLMEAEAFWMMLRSPDFVKEWFTDFCYKQHQ